MNPNRLIGDVKLDEGLRLGPDYRPPAADDPLRLPRRRRVVRDRDRALLRDGQVPQPRQPDDVPELPRHPRGAPLDARPLPAAVRDAQGRPGHRRLARRGGQGVARPVPVLQGLHRRLPGPGRHPDLQGRVPGPLLRTAPPAAAPLRARACCPGGGRSRRARPGWSTRSATRRRSPRPAKRLLGIAEERELPRFARQTFRSWFATNRSRERRAAAARGPAAPARRAVAGHVHRTCSSPTSARPRSRCSRPPASRSSSRTKHLCCGRPLYDFGMLGLAKRTLRDVLDALSEPIESGVPVLVLEPSCASVFRDELRKLMPHDEHARRLVRPDGGARRAARRATRPTGTPPQRRAGAALIHGHCHHKARDRRGGQGRDLLTRAGVEAEMTNAGCCGMAGSFGYERRRALRGLDADRRAVPAAGGPRRGRRHVAGSGRVLVPDPDRPPARAAARSTPPKCCKLGLQSIA